MGSVPEGGERGIAGELWWGGKGERFKRTFLSRRILSSRECVQGKAKFGEQIRDQERAVPGNTFPLAKCRPGSSFYYYLLFLSLSPSLFFFSFFPMPTLYPSTIRFCPLLPFPLHLLSLTLSLFLALIFRSSCARTRPHRPVLSPIKMFLPCLAQEKHGSRFLGLDLLTS